MLRLSHLRKELFGGLEAILGQDTAVQKQLRTLRGHRRRSCALAWTNEEIYTGSQAGSEAV